MLRFVREDIDFTLSWTFPYFCYNTMKVGIMRVALVHMGFFYSGGGERTVLSEALGLRRRGFDVEVFAPTVSRECHPGLLERVQPCEMAGWLPRGIPYRNYLGMLTTSLAAMRVARRLSGFDCVVAHSQPSYWLANRTKAAYGTPYVAYLHQANRFLYPRGVDEEVGWANDSDMQLLSAMHKLVGVIKPLDRASVEGADRVLVNSVWIKRQVEEAYHVDAKVCYPGADLGVCDSGRGPRVEAPYILSTNRHYPQKRLDWFVACLRGLADRGIRVNGVVTGRETRYTEHLRGLAERLGVSGCVRFTGGVAAAELSSLYRGTSVYSYPSPQEDFGLGPLEAAAYGVPSVVWDYAGPREVVVDGVTGYRARPYSLDDYVEKHARLLGDDGLRARMGAAARRRVTELFTWERHVDGLVKAIEAST